MLEFHTFVKNLIVKSVPHDNFVLMLYTVKGRRANSIVNCFIAIVGGMFSDLVVLWTASFRTLFSTTCESIVCEHIII